MDGYNLYKRLRDYQTDHLYFLSHPEIDYTNNISERQLRKFKRKQKQAVVLRSDTTVVPDNKTKKKPLQSRKRVGPATV